MAPLSARVVTSATRKVLERFASQRVPPPTARRVGTIVTATTSEVKKMCSLETVLVRSDCASHPPNPNPFEMRNSSPLELISASLGFKPIHILEDGTKKSPSQIVADSTAFKERGQWLTAQENWYPHPKQTSVREKARAEMLRELNYLKAAETISLEERGFGNHNALLRYEKVLEEQKDAREVANAELYGGCKDWSEKASE